MANAWNRDGRKNDLGYWVAAVILLASGLAAPIGILMIVLKLLGGTKKGRHPYYARRDGQNPLGARTSAPQAGQTPQSEGKGRSRKGKSAARDLVSQLNEKGKKLVTVGGLVAAVFAAIILTALGDASYWLLNGEPKWFVSDLMDMIPMLCFMGGGLGCLWAGLRKRRQASRYRSYLAMIGRRKSVSVSALAEASGQKPARVREDLEDMLEEGLIPVGFLDYGDDVLVLSAEGLEDEPPEPQQVSRSGEVSPEDAILNEIREVNDGVANEKLSAQIDRVGVITAKILEYQKSRPEKSAQLHSFLSYYLPTTLKILRAYGQLESQEVTGINITSAMERIENMMDKVVEGFEKQLDQLFQGETMDITADVEVLERMLAKDGLSDQQGMTLNL